MVSIISITILALGAIAFLGLGGSEKIKAFGSTFKLGEIFPSQNQPRREELTGSTLEAETLQAGSEGIKTNIASAQILRGAIQQKRTFQRPQMDIKTVNVPASPAGVLPKRTAIARPVPPGSANLSAGGITLTTAQIAELKNRPLTSVEKADLVALTQRFNRKSVRGQRVATDPLDLIKQKRAQEAISMRVLESLGLGSFIKQNVAFSGFDAGVRVEGPGSVRGGPETDPTRFERGLTATGFSLGGVNQGRPALNANPKFILGGKTLEQFRDDQARNISRQQRIASNKLDRERQVQVGTDIQMIAGLSEKSQRLFLLSKGITLSGGPLNARALGKLREAGRI